jgi:ATP-dependent Zn protease
MSPRKATAWVTIPPSVVARGDKAVHKYIKNNIRVEGQLNDSNGMATKTIERYSPTEIHELRDDLFHYGSRFKPVERDEVVGIENVLVKIDRVIHWLRNSSRYQRHDSRLEPGIILEGQPGVGKTLVSRYIATASEATFINVRDFEIEEATFKASDIADLFNRARAKYEETEKPVVLFWDEFESAAVNRDDAMDPGQAATVSQITAELDGIHGKNEGLLLIGCTNYLEGIDPALRRSGRMGVQLEFHCPDRQGKRLLLDHYLKTYTLKGHIDTDTLSYFFDAAATAADIEEAAVEAWRYAVERDIRADKDDPTLSQDDLMRVFIERLVGPPMAFVNLSDEDTRSIAIHECGHAIAASIFGVPLRLITVHPGKKTLGRVMIDDIREHISTHGEIVNHMRCLAGSLAAERVVGVEPMMGNSDDIQMLSRHATSLVDAQNVSGVVGLFNPMEISKWRTKGMSNTTPSISDNVMNLADMEIRKLLSTVEEDAMRVMTSVGNYRILQMADIVVDNVTMTGKQFHLALADVLGTDDFGTFR